MIGNDAGVKEKVQSSAVDLPKDIIIIIFVFLIIKLDRTQNDTVSMNG